MTVGIFCTRSDEDNADADDVNNTRIHHGDVLVIVAGMEGGFTSLEMNVTTSEMRSCMCTTTLPSPVVCVALGSVMSSFGGDEARQRT